MNVDTEIQEGVLYIRAFPQTTRRSSDNKRTTVVINTEGVDRHGTVIDPAGAVLDNYNRNPVFLINHNYDLLAGSGAEITVQNNQVVANIDDDMWDLEDPEIEKYYRKVKSGKMRAASIGFIPLKIEWENEDGEKLDNPIIRKWELLEFSFVTVPSNPGALVTTRQMSIDNKEIRESISNLEARIGELAESRLEIDLEKLTNIVRERLDRQPPSDSESESPKAKDSASKKSVDWEKLERSMIENTTNELLKKLGVK